MTARDVLTGCAAALTIVAAPGLAEALGTALTGVPTVSTPAQVGEAAPVWTKPRTAMREASRSRTAAPSPTGTLHWDRLAQCESSGNPRAVSPSGRYRGMYQADADFWRTYGGLRYAPRPDLATAAEQTIVAQRGYAARGATPWPTCGRFLR